jgi:sugar (pentulose or hexulose) kinase
MHSYQICVALDERFRPNDVSIDLRTNQQHPLHQHDVHIAASHGRAVLVLTFTAVDLWTAILSGGLVVLTYFERASTLAALEAGGIVRGLTAANSTPAHIARAAVEGVLCGLADCLDALLIQGARPERLLLVGGAARSAAMRRIAPTVFFQPVMIPRAEEFGAYGAARQAAWTLTSTPEPPAWPPAEAPVFHAEAIPSLRARFSHARGSVSR